MSLFARGGFSIVAANRGSRIMECACVSFGEGKYVNGSFSVICRVSVIKILLD